jgi:hypothetical protein
MYKEREVLQSHTQSNIGTNGVSQPHEITDFVAYIVYSLYLASSRSK